MKTKRPPRDQGWLFDQPTPKPKPDGPDPVPGKTETSREAAEQVKSKTPQQREQVFAFVRDQGNNGATRDEVGAALKLPAQSATPRVLELINAGRLFETDQRRQTRGGCSAVVLVALTAGDYWSCHCDRKGDGFALIRYRRCHRSTERCKRCGADRPRGFEIPATGRHDAGAVARCSYCDRYTTDPRSLSDEGLACECGKSNYWSESFRRPDDEAEWFPTTPTNEGTK